MTHTRSHVMLEPILMAIQDDKLDEAYELLKVEFRQGFAIEDEHAHMVFWHTFEAISGAWLVAKDEYQGWSLSQMPKYFDDFEAIRKEVGKPQFCAWCGSPLRHLGAEVWRSTAPHIKVKILSCPDKDCPRPKE